MEVGRGGAYVPARVALQGRIHRSRPRTMRLFLVWKRRDADVRAGMQAPPLRFYLGRLRVDVRPHAFRLEGDMYKYRYSACVNVRGGNQACRACTFVSPGLPTIGGYPG